MGKYMGSHQLSFAQITILREDIAEVVVNEGVEMDMTMVNEYHTFLLGNLKAPFSLLINKIYSYSYTFLAQRNLAELEEIHSMAVVSYTSTSKQSTLALADGIVRDIPWNLQIFNDKDSALHWVESQQNNLQVN